MNSPPDWQYCASHPGYSLHDPLATLFSVPLVRETTTSIGFCAPFFDSHVPLRYSHMGHFQILGVQYPLNYASDAIQRPRHTVYYRGMILYGIVFPVQSRRSIGRLLEEHASHWAALVPSQMRP